MAEWQARSESHNHLWFTVETQADLGASAWPAGAPGKKTADSAAVQCWMTWCTTALQNRPSHSGTMRILCSAVLRWSSEKGSHKGQGLPAGTRQHQSNVLRLQDHSRRESQLTGKAKGRTSRYCPKKSHSAKVSSMIQDRVRCQAACQRLLSAQSHYCTNLLTWLCNCFICTQIQSNSVKLQPERPVL